MADPGNKFFLNLAHFAVSSQVDRRLEFYDTVLKVIKVWTRIDPGRKFKIVFSATESTCPVTVPYSKDECRPKPYKVKKICVAVIEELPGRTSVIDYNCSAIVH